MAKLDPLVADHLEWLGFVQPTGLVVSATALVRAGAILDRRDFEGQRLLRDCVDGGSLGPDRDETPTLCGFKDFAGSVLGWSFSPNGYAGTPEAPIPPELEVHLPEYGETLKPDYAVRERDPVDAGSPWQLIVRIVPPEQGLDATERGRGRLEASAHGRMERLLRETRVPAGLLSNGHAVRLISAPRGESSGWLDFKVADMVQTAGRPISTAMRLLLDEQRLLALPREKRLAALLEDSRKYQNEVSEKLSAQVLHALYELLRGLQSAHDRSNGKLLRETLDSHPDSIYQALLTVVMRLVFLLYAEERDMLPEDETFLRYYSVVGLHERLREDAALYPDTMTQRFGAWAQLLSLFRIIHDGTESGPMGLPARRGVLFDPDRFPFLEGRPNVTREPTARIEPPLVPDANVYRALEQLLVLDGERISYRALDVEQLGSVYETMMGFRLEMASGRSVAVRAQGKWGAATAIDLEALSAEPSAKRPKWVQDRAGRKLSDKVAKAVKAAESVDDLHAALGPVIDAAATPDILPEQAMVLQPSEERRRSGSHYTPRSLTEPIVRTTLEPILARLRGGSQRPLRPEQILDLKICDPAMGSGAFLVEACRQLGDALVESWKAYDALPEIPPDEDEVVFARRLVAQRCLYGVDRNPMAVDLAKTSLWLVTLARDHSLTFLAHALKHGDSLVGLTRAQIEAFHWESDAKVAQVGFETLLIRDHLSKATETRELIRQAADTVPDEELRNLWDQVETETDSIRLFGDLAVAAFFDGSKPKEREAKRAAYAAAITEGDAGSYRSMLDERRNATPPLAPFHWEIEFPEVFERDDPGFAGIVGNPPFSGKNTVASANYPSYPDWLKSVHEDSHGNADLVAHFYRRAFGLLRVGGALGLIATNTISQGDTRSTGLRWICANGGEIYAARKRVEWPGLAAVVVSVVHVSKGPKSGATILDGRPVELITAFLFHRGGNEDPSRLAENRGKGFQGTIVLGMGFTFDDNDTKDIATPLVEMHALIEQHHRDREIILPYIGGEEVNSSPTQAPHRFVINFGERSEQECRSLWPELMSLVEEKVKPARDELKNNPDGRRRKKYWWQFGRYTPALFNAIEGLSRVLVISQVTQHVGFVFLPAGMVYSHRLYVFADDRYSFFGVLQSMVHEVWARHFGSSLEDKFMYAVVDCFETFPFPHGWIDNTSLATIAKACYERRASTMISSGEGLTKTYNRFHDPDDQGSDVKRLREVHIAMDRAVLDAYGWADIPAERSFLLEYEIDKEASKQSREPWRYRWSDDVRHEVLARLLELNSSRAAKEAGSGR